MRGEVLRQWGRLGRAGLASFSFVVREPLDVTTAASLARLHGLPPERIWVTPEGTTSDGVVEGAREIVESALISGFNVGIRMHVALWGPTAHPGPVTAFPSSRRST